MIPITYNLQSLSARKATTAATVAGMALVVFVLAAALMLGNGIERTLARAGSADVILILRQSSGTEMASKIDLGSAQIVRALPEIRSSSGHLLFAGETVTMVTTTRERTGSSTGSPGEVNVLLRGTSAGSSWMRPNFRIVAGRMPQSGTEEAILGVQMRGRFRGAELNQSFALRGSRSLRIVGLFADAGSAYESELWAEQGLVADLLGEPGLMSSLRVQIQGPLANFKRHLAQDKRLGLVALTESEYFVRQSADNAFLVRAAGVLLALLFAVSAGLGALSMLYGTVESRRREIGILRAIGFSRGAVLAAFLVEAQLLSVLGAVLGLALALLLQWFQFPMVNLNTLAETLFTFELSTEVVLSAALMAGLVGLIGGLFPALRAAAISPALSMKATG
ncbi:MAG: ABC transporter permease [Polyangia bacterium]